MNISEIRKLKLEQLISRYGSQKELANEINIGLASGEKQISETQISGAIKGKRNFAEKICRKIERALKIADRWMDQLNDITNTTPELSRLIENWNAMPDESRALLLATSEVMVREAAKTNKGANQEA